MRASWHSRCAGRAFLLGLLACLVWPRALASPARNASAYRSVSFLARAAGPPPPPPPADASPALLDGCYWGRQVEAALPRGYDVADDEAWRDLVRSSAAVRLEEGCGRMQNRRVVFEDGSQACCRYRQNTDQIQGEIFSFYLGRLLGLRNLVPSALSLVRRGAPQWARVQPRVAQAQWQDERAVVLTRNVSRLEAAYIPARLRAPDRRLHPRDVPLRGDLAGLAQWTDLVVFDYLTANLDRVVNNLFNQQWNPAMMDAPAHNLARRRDSGLLVFLDNESGLLHGYRLLAKYERYHATLLSSLCVFRRPTAEALKTLRRDRDVGRLLREAFSAWDPGMADYLPAIPDHSVKILNERIDRVFEQVTQCERQYPPRDEAS
ncbi:extracellular serine/threonine protein kinase four-jointed [Bacillus rossius redtenbacheri]|uniref:extracellular serine/threonine protein kinase four-jointed n=1 Tax=Bacillus rossius redtenbacheri TaxID=93214 RepID=UPI002FDE2710